MAQGGAVLCLGAFGFTAAVLVCADAVNVVMYAGGGDVFGLGFTTAGAGVGLYTGVGASGLGGDYAFAPAMGGGENILSFCTADGAGHDLLSVGGTGGGNISLGNFHIIVAALKAAAIVGAFAVNPVVLGALRGLYVLCCVCR